MIVIVCCFLSCIVISSSKVCRNPEGVVKCCPGYMWNRIENRCVVLDLTYDSTFLKHQNVYTTPQTTSFNRQANTSIHQEKPNEKESKSYELLIYFIFSLLVITFILCLLYVRLVFRCSFAHSYVEE